MTGRNLAGLHAKGLRDILAPLIPRAAEVALVGFPDSNNCGEHAAWLGEKALLAELRVRVAYECSPETYDAEALRARTSGGAILVHGDPARRLPKHGDFLARVLADFPGNRIVLLPHRVTAFADSELARLAAAFATHADLTVMARGVGAQQQLSRHCGSKARILLAPDMAFMLGPQVRPAEPQFDIVWIARTDQERSSRETEVAARLSTQSAEKFTLPPGPDGVELSFVVRQRPPTVLLTDWQSLVFDNVEARLAYGLLGLDARSQAQLHRALHVLSLGRIVITDRLHAHVLCLLLGLPHILLDDDSGKNFAFHQTWTRDSNLCRTARNPKDAWTAGRESLAALKESDGEWSWQVET